MFLNLSPTSRLTSSARQVQVYMTWVATRSHWQPMTGSARRQRLHAIAAIASMLSCHAFLCLGWFGCPHKVLPNVVQQRWGKRHEVSSRQPFCINLSLVIVNLCVTHLGSWYVLMMSCLLTSWAHCRHEVGKQQCKDCKYHLLPSLQVEFNHATLSRAFRNMSRFSSSSDLALSGLSSPFADTSRHHTRNIFPWLQMTRATLLVGEKARTMLAMLL